MAYLIFAQTHEARLPLVTLAAHARVHSSLAIVVCEESTAGDVASLEVSDAEAAAVFRIRSRRTEPSDVSLAREAELRGRAAGMADLAARCPTTWLLDPEDGVPEWLTLELCALLAFTALGPVLPPDASTLLGVRSAREKAERLRG